jgi:(1->4)-alpha-D-glucan 1-alpha-D-glucosylmutase
LRARRADTDLYLHGDYVPLPVAGTRAGHVFAFARAFDPRAAVVVVPRLTTTLLAHSAVPIGRDVWGDTRVMLPQRIAEQAWRNVFTDEIVGGERHLDVSQVLRRLPVALLRAD